MAFLRCFITTIYLDEKWYERKKPQLKIEILACLAIKGKLSKSRVSRLLAKRYYYPDTFNSFEELEQKEHIQLSHYKSGRGRKEAFYKITDNGLAILIADDPRPDKFWKAMIGFCYHREDKISPDKIEAFFRLFCSKYLKFSSPH